MDATEGWVKLNEGRYKKTIYGIEFWCWEIAGGWLLGVSTSGPLAMRPTLLEILELAHATAALWKGEG